MKKILKSSLFLLTLLYISILGLGYFIFKNEYIHILRFLLTWILLGLSILPLTFYIFHSYPSAGYIFSKPLGLICSGGLLWALSVFKLAPYTGKNCWLFLGIIAIVSYGFLYLKTRRRENHFSLQINAILLQEILLIELAFMLLFFLWCYLKSGNPAAYQTEKMMDYGFLLSTYKTKYLPAYDMWYAGEQINYYYVGFYFCSFVIHLSGVGVPYGYNLILISLPVLACIMSFYIVKMLLTNSFHSGKSNHRIVFIGSALSGLGIMCAGNLHYVIYGLFHLLPSRGGEYSYLHSIRYIGYDPDVADKPIHEIPSYSFINGDLHPHTINIIFVLLFLGVLCAWALRIKFAVNNQVQTVSSIKNHRFTEPVVLGILLGFFKSINYWDFPIYLVVATATIFWFYMMEYKKIKLILTHFLIDEVLLLIISKIVSLPFDLHFHMITSSVGFVENHTPLYQLMIIWGIPLALFVIYLYHCIFDLKKSWGDGLLEPHDSFVIILAFSSLGLILLPEIIYVKDIYDITYQRANTMFKLTYQAYIMLTLCIGYMLLRIWMRKGKDIFKYVSGIIGVIYILSFGYFQNGITAWFSPGLTDGYQSLDSTAFLENMALTETETTYNDKQAIDWINSNLNYPDVVLESYGYPYSYYGRISTYTGFQTIMGWIYHEWIWRLDPENIQTIPTWITERVNDVTTIYTGTNREKTIELLKKYNVSYIVIGYNEKNHPDWTEPVNEDLLKRLGDVVFSSGEGTETEIYIIKLEK